jgi:hypothetical protein
MLLTPNQTNPTYLFLRSSLLLLLLLLRFKIGISTSSSFHVFSITNFRSQFSLFISNSLLHLYLDDNNIFHLNRKILNKIIKSQIQHFLIGKGTQDFLTLLLSILYFTSLASSSSSRSCCWCFRRPFTQFQSSSLMSTFRHDSGYFFFFNF